jgi:hypothetical protein
MVFVFTSQHPVVFFRNPGSWCDRTFIRLLLFFALLLSLYRLFVCVPAFALHGSLSISRDSNHLCEQLCAHEAKYALSFFREEVDRPINVQV